MTVLGLLQALSKPSSSSVTSVYDFMARLRNNQTGIPEKRMPEGRAKIRVVFRVRLGMRSPDRVFIANDAVSML